MSLHDPALGATADLLRDYRAQGFAIVRGFLSPGEAAKLGDAIDAVEADALAHGRSFRHGNLHYRLGPAGDVRMAQWPSYAFPALDAVRLDRRYARLLAPFLDGDLKQIINQLHWKPRGGKGGDFAWHQDSRFRKPLSAFRDLGATYVQTGLAIDPHDEEAGGLRFVPGSHRQGDLAMALDRDVLDGELDDAVLRAAGLDPASVVTLDLKPGDLALWNPYLVHASGANNAVHRRRFYINGYVRASACDRGEWAFRGGEPVPLGPEPALVHFEDLYARPEPHYP